MRTLNLQQRSKEKDPCGVGRCKLALLECPHPSGEETTFMRREVMGASALGERGIAAFAMQRTDSHAGWRLAELKARGLELFQVSRKAQKKSCHWQCQGSSPAGTVLSHACPTSRRRAAMGPWECSSPASRLTPHLPSYRKEVTHCVCPAFVKFVQVMDVKCICI